MKVRDVKIDEDNVLFYYFGGVKDSRGSGMYESRPFWDKIGHAKFVGFRFFWLFDEVRAELVRDISRSLRFL